MNKVLFLMLIPFTTVISTISSVLTILTIYVSSLTNTLTECVGNDDYSSFNNKVKTNFKKTSLKLSEITTKELTS